MSIKITEGDLVISDRDANVLAGLATIGMVTVGVTAYQVGYMLAVKGFGLMFKAKDKIKEKLNK